jgi:hypothetical protein
MAFRCGIRMSFRQVRKPHMKKSIVAMLMARTSVLRRPDWRLEGTPTLIAIVKNSLRYGKIKVSTAPYYLHRTKPA